MRHPKRPVDGHEIVRLAIEWYKHGGPGDSRSLHDEDALLAALATRPECYDPSSPAAGSLPDSTQAGPVDAVKTCPGESPPAGSLFLRSYFDPARGMQTFEVVEPPLHEIAKGTTGSGDDEDEPPF